MLDRALVGRYGRVKHYLEFVTNCPGPGLVRDRTVSRGMELEMALRPDQVSSGADLQRVLRDGLIKNERFWKRVMVVGRIISWLGIVSILALVLFKNRLI